MMCVYGCCMRQRQWCVCTDAVWGNVNDACVWMLYEATSMMRVYGCCMRQRQ